MQHPESSVSWWNKAFKISSLFRCYARYFTNLVPIVLFDLVNIFVSEKINVIQFCYNRIYVDLLYFEVKVKDRFRIIAFLSIHDFYNVMMLDTELITIRLFKISRITNIYLINLIL